LDTDDFYWKRTKIPFSEKNPAPERLTQIRKKIANESSWVLSGSICSWGDSLAEQFTHVIYLWVPWATRKERLKNREEGRYGSEIISPTGSMHKIHSDFMDWASRYDSAGLEQRSRVTHEKWIENLPDHVKIIRIEENLPPSEVAQLAIDQIDSNKSVVTTSATLRDTSA